MKRRSLLYVLPAILFVVLAAYVLICQQADVLYTAQDRNEFFSTSSFFSQIMAEPFGLMAYLGSFLTQFFYYPALGASILIFLWCVLYGVTVKVFSLGVRLSALAILPLACLLASVTDLAYWIYIMPFRGYWFAQTLAILCVILMLWAARCTPARFRVVWYLIGTLAAFPFLGWATYLFALCFLVTQCAESADRRMPLWHHIVGVLLAFSTPLLYARLFYTSMHPMVVAKASLPYFESTTVASLRPSYPFITLFVILLLLAALMPLWRRCNSLDKVYPFYRHPVYATVLVSLLFSVGIYKAFAFEDYNYQAEMRMNQAAVEDDWQSIIQEAENTRTPSRTMVVLKNIALMNSGELGTRSFLLNNNGIDINNPDSLNLNVMQIAAPTIYYHYGKVQFAFRWCMENAVGYGFSPYYMKMFIRAAKESGEHRLVERYKKLMSHTLFHGNWQPRPTTMLVRDLHVGFADVIDGDNNDLERYLIENFMLAFGSDKPLIKELNLFYTMIYREPSQFWNAFYAYALESRGANLPMHYQEAYLIMQENYPVQLPFKVQITPMVQQNYNLYKQAVISLESQGLDRNQQGERLRDSWQHTYWYYLMYGRMTY